MGGAKLAKIKISLINSSTIVSNAEIQAALPALQTQISRDFMPVWGVDADLDFVPHRKNPAKGHWGLLVLDDSDRAGDVGYHDLTKEGLPQGKVFARTLQHFKAPWTIMASHELLEMLVDPDIDITVMTMTDIVLEKNVVGRLFAYEVCDACERDSYEIDSVVVSDFVYPAWFESFHKKGSTQFDHEKKIRRPFEIRPGGYIGIYDLTAGTGWQQISKPFKAAKLFMLGERAAVGSRRERRRTPRNRWLRSDPK
jgi:hypothetical protein